MSNSETGTQSGITSYGLDDRPLGFWSGSTGPSRPGLLCTTPPAQPSGAMLR